MAESSNGPRALTVVLTREAEQFVAVCIENDVASSGATLTEVVENVTDALGLWLSETEPDVQSFQLTIFGRDVITGEVPPAALSDAERRAAMEGAVQS